MRDILLVCVLAAFFIIGYYKMEKVDETIEKIKKPKRILIIYDDDFEYLQDYSNEETMCLSKNDLIDLSQQFTSIIICTLDDYYNLLMNYRIQRHIQFCHVYAICHEQQYLNLYNDGHIHTLQTKEDIKGLIGRLYEPNMETTHKC